MHFIFIGSPSYADCPSTYCYGFFHQTCFASVYDCQNFGTNFNCEVVTYLMRSLYPSRCHNYTEPLREESICSTAVLFKYKVILSF